MSKIGLRAVSLGKTALNVNGNNVEIKGPKGVATFSLPEEISISVKNEQVEVKPKEQTFSKKVKALWGMTRATLANKIKGVETGFETKINIVGLGFKAILNGKNLNFSLGYSHKIDIAVPGDISVSVSKTGQELMVSGIDKFIVGNFCAQIKSLKRVEPYKGKGISLEGDRIYRKAGKTKKA